MAFFPDVKAGEPFRPNALLSNNVRHIVNQMDGFLSGVVKGQNNGPIKIQVQNSDKEKLKSGTAVNFEMAKPDEFVDFVKSKKFETMDEAWGIIAYDLEPNQIGDCVIIGPATVEVTGNGKYASPNPADTSKFIRGSSGVPVICAKEKKAVVLLGGNPGGYDGPFKVEVDQKKKVVTIGPGFINTGSNIISTEKFELKWDDIEKSGWLCVCFDPESEETDVIFEVVSEPDIDHYPIAKLKKSEEEDSDSENDDDSGEDGEEEEKKATITFFQLHVPEAHLPSPYSGPFKVKIVQEESEEEGEDPVKMISVSSGPVLANGDFFETEETELELEEGYVCVHIELKENGEWSEPEILAGAEPGALNVPIANITRSSKEVDGETVEVWNVTQFYVPRAVFIIAKYECPMAGVENDEQPEQQ